MNHLEGTILKTLILFLTLKEKKRRLYKRLLKHTYISKVYHQHISLNAFMLFVSFCNRASLCSSDYPGTLYVDHAGLELTVICLLLLLKV